MTMNTSDLQNQIDFKKIFPKNYWDFLQSAPYGVNDLIVDVGSEFAIKVNGIPVYSDIVVTQDDIEYILTKIKEINGLSEDTDFKDVFNAAGRTGLNGHLHRISVIFVNKKKVINNLTIRIGLPIIGCSKPLDDIIASGKSIVIIGGPGTRKTTLLRDMARSLSTEHQRSVVVVDTSDGELTGSGTRHPAVGRARIFPGGVHELASLLDKTIAGHSPGTIIADEVVNPKEVVIASRIANRGVQVIVTAHANGFLDFISNSAFDPLTGYPSSTTVSDARADKSVSKKKNVKEQQSVAAFKYLVHIYAPDIYVIYDLEKNVDPMFKQEDFEVEIRSPLGKEVSRMSDLDQTLNDIEVEWNDTQDQQNGGSQEDKVVLRLFTAGINRFALNKAISEFDSQTTDVVLVSDIKQADKALVSPNRYLSFAGKVNVPVYINSGKLSESLAYIL